MNKEALIWYENENGWWGHTANLPIVVHGDTLEEMTERAKEVLKIYLDNLNDLYESGNPFELINANDIPEKFRK